MTVTNIATQQQMYCAFDDHVWNIRRAIANANATTAPIHTLSSNAQPTR
jgi:hypothetical protein